MSFTIPKKFEGRPAILVVVPSPGNILIAFSPNTPDNNKILYLPAYLSYLHRNLPSYNTYLLTLPLYLHQKDRINNCANSIRIKIQNTIDLPRGRGGSGAGLKSEDTSLSTPLCKIIRLTAIVSHTCSRKYPARCSGRNKPKRKYSNSATYNVVSARFDPLNPLS